MENNGYVINWTNGDPDQTYDTYQEALASLLAQVPDAVYDAEYPQDCDGTRQLFWFSEEDAQNDDGRKAFASIREVISY